MPEFVRLEVDDGVGLVRLDRPPANAIDHQVGLELQEVLREAERRDDIGALVVWGGRKLFAAGADVKAMAGYGPSEIGPVVAALGDALDLLESIPKISIAAINGYALGGGFELALAADLRYLAEDATIGQPEIKLGVIPGAGGTQRIVRVAGVGVAADLIYSGRGVGAQEAQRLLLAHRVIEPDGVLDAATADARSFAFGPRDALAAAKQAIRAASENPSSVGRARERDLFVSLFDTSDQREGMRAFLEKRDPRFGGDKR
ncbi:MAG: enoyl-CoA hydratase-related protein [Actinomycetota bacterium]|nr:enoyl-CoA hydratase-related protein [Actinomycetota bacterium]